MIIVTRVKDKFFYGNKIVCPITEEEYNLFKEIGVERIPIPGRGFVTFGSDFVFDADIEKLIKEFDTKVASVKKEMQAIKNQKLKMKA